MRRLWFLCLCFLIWPTKIGAVDLLISDPVISSLDITVNASFSGSVNNYLQGTLRSQSSSRYFGETQNTKGDWIDYVSAPEKEYIASNFFLTEIKNASWSGQLKLRFKIDDPNYQGPGNYDLKLRRFTGSSTGSAGESNTLSIMLSAPLSTPTPSPSPSLFPSPSPTQTSIPIPIPTQSPTSATTPKPSIAPSPSIYPQESTTGTVAGISTEIDLSGFGVLASPSEHPTLQGQSLKGIALNKKRAKTAIIVGSGLILTSLASYFGYRRYLAIKRLEDCP